jgi:CheY-like chemotaxis protein
VYLIDDDLELMKVIEARFIKFGCEVRPFSKPDLLLSAFKSAPPQLLLVDLNLGDGFSGFDIIKEVRGNLKSDAPIVILSGDKDLKNIAHGLEIGANDYIVKPPLKQHFEEVISQFITAENLAETALGVFHGVASEKQSAKLAFKVLLEEIHPGGLTLLSDHLVKKGASFYLEGLELEKLIPGVQKIFVSVIGSTAKVVDNQKKYQLHLEVDASQEEVLKGINKLLAVSLGPNEL